MADKSVADKLCTASASGNLPDVLFLLQNGADVNGLNTFKRTPLQVVKWGHDGVLEVLLKAGADPHVRDPVLGLTAMHDAAREGHPRSVRLLLDHGADTNLVDDQGNLPLHLAAREGHLQAIQLLIVRTADPRACNGLGHSARALALLHKKMDIVAFIDEFLGVDE